MSRSSDGRWKVIGVGSGGGPADFAQKVPVCTNDTPDRRDNVGPSVERFRNAPRFAGNIAVYRRPDNASATAVYAVDSDIDSVVYRARNGTNPTYTDHFSFWGSLGTPYPRAELTRIAACAADSSARPQIFVVDGGGRIYTRLVLPSGNWGSWSYFGTVGGVHKVTDIDTATDPSGRCLLLAVSSGGAFARAKSSDTSWGDWHTVAGGSYGSVTAINYSGVTWAALIDKSGETWRTSLGQAGWTLPKKVDRPPGVTRWQDIDMTWDEAGRGFMLAVPTSGGNRLWFMPMYGSKAWAEWHFFETHLWAPSAAPQNAPKMMSITASRWMEDPTGTTSPVVFGTDDYGNIYFVEYARTGTSGWVLDWKSFYHEYIPYD